MFFSKFVALVLSFVSVCSKKCTSTYDIAVGCNMTYGVELDVIYDVTAVIQCAVQCSGDARCVSATSDPVTGVCRTNLELYGDLTTDCPDTLTYVSLTEISCRKMVNDDCAISDDCLDANSNCRDNTCLCAPGYSYSHTEGTCVESCEVYGSSFTPDMGHLISGFNTLVLYNADAQTCQDQCAQQTTFLCRTAEFSTTDRICYLSEETALTASSGYMQSSSYILYQRNCLF